MTVDSIYSGVILNLRSSSRSGSNSTSPGVVKSPRRIAMSTVSDALDVAKAATAAAEGRLDAVEQSQIHMTAQLTGINQ